MEGEVKPFRAGAVRARSRGVTLMEMLIVVTLLGLLAGIAFPSVNAGIDSLRLSAASDSIVSLLNGALNRAERRQQVMEVLILKPERTIRLRSADPGFSRDLVLPDGVVIEAVLPEIPGIDENAPRQFLLHPGGTVPRLGVQLVNRRGVRRILRVDPITGVPEIERPEGQ